MRSSPSPINRSCYLGQVVVLDHDYSYDVKKAGTAITISTSAWSSNNNTTSLSGASSTGDRTTVEATAANSGRAMVENTVTLSNGDILKRYYRLTVLDPMQENSRRDYP